MNLITDWFCLSAEPSAVQWGRRHVEAWLRSWRLDHLIYDAKLIASELLTNAMRATGTPDPTPGYAARGQRRLIAVRLCVSGPSLFLEVWDSSAAPPTVRATDHNAEGGRGMPLVASLSQKWGVWRPRDGGKVVYAQLPLQPPPPQPAEQPEAAPVAAPLPGQVPMPGPVAPVAPVAPMPGPVAPRPRPGQVPRPGPVAPDQRPGPMAPTPGQVPRPGPGPGAPVAPRPGPGARRPGPGQVPRPGQVARPRLVPVPVPVAPRPVTGTTSPRRVVVAPGPVATRPRPVAPEPVPLWAVGQGSGPDGVPRRLRTDLTPAEFEQIIDVLAAMPV